MGREVEADACASKRPRACLCGQVRPRPVEKLLEDMPPDSDSPAVKPAPEPVPRRRVEHVALLEADAPCEPIENEARHGAPRTIPGRATGGEPQGVEIEGRVLLLMDWHIRGPMGKAKVRAKEAVVRGDTWFDQRRSSYRQTTELAPKSKPGKHFVAFEILSEKNATQARVPNLGLGAAGVAEIH